MPLQDPQCPHRGSQGARAGSPGCPCCPLHPAGTAQPDNVPGLRQSGEADQWILELLGAHATQYLWRICRILIISYIRACLVPPCLSILLYRDQNGAVQTALVSAQERCLAAAARHPGAQANPTAVAPSPAAGPTPAQAAPLTLPCAVHGAADPLHPSPGSAPGGLFCMGNCTRCG